ncbi:hypothetical protein SAMN04487946_1118 [Halobellus clavatus]|uniref:Uncharacterized protein n=1 Tax=Halobellus clavatus TaxID=660517 RepID=A0A1H3IUS2_9EURY|nr:hypothetical protein SAMN04487946_1118 [Halobellus clavatus]
MRWTAPKTPGMVGRGREFYVEGTQTIRTEVTPDEIIQHIKKRSPSLKTRYGLEDPVLEETERIDRENPEEDGLPKRKAYTETLPWKTYYATEEEWSALYNGDAEAVTSADTAFGTPTCPHDAPVRSRI